MNNQWVIVVFSLLLMFALAVVFYPLRKKKLIVAALAPVMIVVIIFGYWRWGSWSGWQDYLRQDARQQQVQVMLKSIKGPQELIDKLKAKLSTNPDSARGWYLLGRLYASQNDWQQSHDAFARAHQLQSDDEQITVNYAQSIWQLNNRQFDDKSRDLFNAILKKNPQQPDALAMLAMNAFMSHDYQQAIDYWQRLLNIAPPDSEDAKAIRKAIAKAQKLIGESLMNGSKKSS